MNAILKSSHMGLTRKKRILKIIHYAVSIKYKVSIKIDSYIDMTKNINYSLKYAKVLKFTRVRYRGSTYNPPYNNSLHGRLQNCYFVLSLGIQPKGCTAQG